MSVRVIPRVLASASIALAIGCNSESPSSNTSELTTCPGTNVVEDPANFNWTYHPATAGNPEAYYSGTLQYGEAIFDINGQTLQTRAYRQKGGSYSIPGPTIRMTPGNKYVLRFENLLPFEAASGEHNVYKDPNVTNVHTHGLHISPASPSDDVSRMFEGGFGGDYVYDISADHMGGTFWYHAHHHGATYLQVSTGGFGLMIIDDGADNVPANVAAMTEREVIIGYLDRAAAGTGGDTLVAGSFQSKWTVNGLDQGTLCMPQGEWQHFRLLLADAASVPRDVGIGSNCEVALMARDGVWRTTAPKVLGANEISLTGASRADLAVRCSDDSEITVNGNTVATIAVSGSGDLAPHPYAADGVSTWSADRPSYLRDLSGETNVNNEVVRMGARTINGSKFDHMNPTFALTTDAVQEWDVRGAGNHPFHLHVYHFQTEGCGGDFEDGEYYDTLASPCTIRFDLDETTSSVFDGPTIMHCHVLAHEDQGAMGWVDVQGGLAPPTFPVDNDSGITYSLLYPVGGTCEATELDCTDGQDEDCDGASDCNDSDCAADPACQTASCGNGTCEAGEDTCGPDWCASDCGLPTVETTCDDGVDEDCDGQTDCDDSDCSADAACQQPTNCNNNGVCEAGEDCNNCSNDCASVTKGNPNNRYCCGDGVQASAEGDGSICDGNY